MNRFYCNTLGATALVAGLSVMPSAKAAVVTWDGIDGEYTVAANWDTDALPNTAGGDTAIINAGIVTYTPGGDLAIHNGGELQINGGSWTQVGGIAWMQLSGGNLTVTGGTFNQGESGNMIRNADTTISVSGGTANLNGNLIYQPTAFGAVTVSGTGTLNVAGEFKPIETFTMSGGTLTAELISFADGPGGIDLAGGTIVVNGAGGNSGFYGADATKALNFTTGSSGVLFFESYTLAELSSDGFLSNNTIQYNGTVDAASFTAVEVDGGVAVSLVVPEPGSLALIGLGVLAVIGRRRVDR